MTYYKNAVKTGETSYQKQAGARRCFHLEFFVNSTPDFWRENPRLAGWSFQWVWINPCTDDLTKSQDTC